METIQDIKQRIHKLQHKENLFDRVVRRLRLNLNGIVFEEEAENENLLYGETRYSCDTNGQHED